MFCLKHDGDVAQLGEHLHGMQGVKGSSPFISTTEIDSNNPLDSSEGVIWFDFRRSAELLAIHEDTDHV